MMTGVLRVAVPPDVAALPAHGGHGRMWHRVLAELRDRVRLEVRPPGPRRLRRPDVWLTDGQAPLPDVPEPLLAQVHQAPPPDPAAPLAGGAAGAPPPARAARALTAPPFLAHLERTVGDAVARADLIITGAHFTAAELRVAYDLPAARVHVAHHGVDLDVF